MSQRAVDPSDPGSEIVPHDDTWRQREALRKLVNAQRVKQNKAAIDRETWETTLDLSVWTREIWSALFETERYEKDDKLRISKVRVHRLQW